MNLSSLSNLTSGGSLSGSTGNIKSTIASTLSNFVYNGTISLLGNFGS